MLITAKADLRPPTAPVLGTPTVTGTTSLSVPLTSAATDLVGVTSYQLERATAAAGPFTQISAAASFPFSSTSLTESTTYFYRATATDAAGNVGTYSAIVSATTAAGSTTINVSTVAQLMAAITTANSVGGNREIVLANGTYTTTDALFVNVPNVTLRSSSGTASAVIIQGDAMTGSAAVPFNVRIAGSGFLAQNLTFGGRCRFSAVQIVGEGGANNGRLSGCIIRDSFEHLLKSSTDNVAGSQGWIIEDCTFMFTAGLAPAQYNGGIDVHRGSNWIVRRNTFRDIASPLTSACQHAVNFWNGSSGNLIERNKVIDCDRGIGSGLSGNPANNNDTIRNNMCYHSANADAFADVQVSVENSLNAKIYNNTVYVANSFTWAMEYRFTTTGTEFRNNLANKTIQLRDGATATLSNNITNAQASYFIGLATGDLRLASSVAGVVDAGVTLATVTDDYEGQARPIGVAYDIGADEFSGDLLSLPLVTQTSWATMVTYLGVMRVPTPFEYGGGGLWVDQTTSRIYGSGIDNGSQPLRMNRCTIPSFGGTGTTVGTAVTIPNSGAPEQARVSGSILYNGKLYVSTHGSYDPGGAQNSTRNWIFRCDPDLTNIGAINRMQPNKNGAARHLAGVFMLIPEIWQSVLGGPMAALSLNASPVNTSCPGHAFGVFDPANVQQTAADVPVDVLLQHDSSGGGNPPAHVIQPGTWWTGSGTTYFSVNDGTMAACIPAGSRSLLFFVVHGSGSGNPECRTGSSTHSGPYSHSVIAYDLRDLVNVKNGVLQPYQPQPYAAWLFTPGDASGPFSTCVDVRQPWSCYDSTTGRFYAHERFIQDDGIYTWQINGLS